MQTLTLDIEYDFSFDLYGVVASCKEYKLAWSLNRLLGFRLIKQQDLSYAVSDSNAFAISNYEYSTEHSTIRLFRNKAIGTNAINKPFLLPDIKEYDYILQITGALQKLHPQVLLQKLQHLPLVQYVKQFDPLTLTFKENLLF